jgi:hypothetical protein
VREKSNTKTKEMQEDNKKIALSFMLIEEKEEEDKLLMSQFILQSKAILLYLQQRGEEEEEGMRKRKEDMVCVQVTMDKIIEQTEKMVEQHQCNAEKRIKGLKKIIKE